MNRTLRKRRLVVALLGAGLVLSGTGAALAGVAPQRQAELRHLVRHDCGSCHGMTLKGGLGPSLLPDALSGKPAAFLEYTILEGRYGTAMPPWRGILDDQEVHWMVEQLRDGKVAR